MSNEYGTYFDGYNGYIVWYNPDGLTVNDKFKILFPYQAVILNDGSVSYAKLNNELQKLAVEENRTFTHDSTHTAMELATAYLATSYARGGQIVKIEDGTSGKYKVYIIQTSTTAGDDKVYNENLGKYLNFAGITAGCYVGTTIEGITGDPDVDYYIGTAETGYVHYRYINNQFVIVGGDSYRKSETYSKTEIDNKTFIGAALPELVEGEEGVDYYIGTANSNYIHYRYIITGGTGKYVVVGEDAYVYDVTYGTVEISGEEVDNVFQLWRYNSDADKDAHINGTLVKQFVIEGGSGGGGSNMTLIPPTSAELNVTSVFGSPINIRAIFADYDKDGYPINATYTCRIVNGVNAVTILTGSLVQCLDSEGNTIYEDDGVTPKYNYFPVTDYCSVGNNTITITATDTNGNIVARTYTRKLINVSISSDYNDSAYIQIGRPATITYTPYGAIQKTVHFKLDGVETTETLNAGIAGTEQQHIITPQLNPETEKYVPGHGSHLLEMWITATIDGSTVETDHIFKDIMWYDSSETSPVIGTVYRGRTVNMTQYDTLSIPYSVYDPTDATPDVALAVDGTTIDTIELEDTHTKNWNYRCNTAGTHTLTITCGNVTATIVVVVTALDIDVSPITTGLVMDFNPEGITNDSNNRIFDNGTVQMSVSDNFDWSNGGYKIDPDTGETYFLIKAGTRASFNHYMFPNDIQHNPAIDGAEMKVIFKTENVRDAGAIWFSNVETTEQSSNTINKGIQMGVHEGWLKTNTASSTDIEEGDESIASTNTYLYMPYSEEDKIEMDINIEPIGNSDKGCVMSYEDGVPAKAFIYGTTDNFYQTTPKPMVFGSDDCDVRIYRLKVYDNSLTTEGVLKNFIADSPDSTTMIDRYNRNSIYYNVETGKYTPYASGGVLTPEGLAEICPDLKVLKLECPVFTTSKKDFVKNSSLQCIHKNGHPFYDNWRFINGYHSGQGTTSDKYGVSARNVDFIFNADGVHNCVSHKEGKDNYIFDNEYISQLILGYQTDQAATYTCLNGNDVSDLARVALTRDMQTGEPISVPNNFFNFKANVASSENVNNALFQKRYNDFLPYNTLVKSLQYYQPVYEPVKSALGNYYEKSNGAYVKTEDTNIVTGKQYYTVAQWDIKNDMEFVPAVLFIKETSNDISAHTEFADTEYHFYALGNLGDSKKTDYTRAYDPDDMNEFTIEISNNTPNNATFQTGVYLDGQGNRVVESISDTSPHKHIYPITPSEWNSNNKRYYTLYNEAFDGDHSFEPRYACCGDYRDGKMVNNSHPSGANAAQLLLNEGVWRAFYRWVITSTNQQFAAELDEWCVRNAVEYFYAFTHNFTMMDNRAKNTFWHFAKTGTFRAVSRPVAELLHIYCEKNSSNEYVPTTDTSINNSKTYYTQYAFDLWDYDNDTALGIKC